MNRTEALTLLRLRSQLTREPHSPDMAEAWAEVLADITLSEARAILNALVRNGAEKIPVGAIAARTASRATPRSTEPEHRGPPPNDATNRRGFKATRAVMDTFSAAGAKRHDHTSHDPCPRCLEHQTTFTRAWSANR